MRLLAMVQGDDNLADVVSSQFWNNVNPQGIVDSTSGDNADTSHHVARIPETDITSEWASIRWVPGHDEKEQLDEDCKDDRGVPGPVACAWQAETLASPAHNEEAYCHCKVEGCGRICLQIDD